MEWFGVLAVGGRRSRCGSWVGDFNGDGDAGGVVDFLEGVQGVPLLFLPK